MWVPSANKSTSNSRLAEMASNLDWVLVRREDEDFECSGREGSREVR